MLFLLFKGRRLELKMDLPLLHEVPVKLSPSILYNNLSSAGDLIVYAHHGDVAVVRPLGPSRVPIKDSDKSEVTHCCITTARGRPIVAVTTNATTHLWDATKEIVLTTIVHGDTESRGCAVVDFGNNMFCAVGHGTGEVTLVEILPDFTPNVFAKHKAHRFPVTAIAASNSVAVFVSADTNGDIHFWNNNFLPFTSISMNGDCATSVSIFQGFVAVAYGSGTIRLFLAESGQIHCEIAAHSRWINAIAYNPMKNILASVGQDSLLCVWAMPTPQNGEVSPLGFRSFPNQLLTGVAFRDDGTSLTCAAHDVDKLFSIGF